MKNIKNIITILALLVFIVAFFIISASSYRKMREPVRPNVALHTETLPIQEYGSPQTQKSDVPTVFAKDLELASNDEIWKSVADAFSTYCDPYYKSGEHMHAEAKTFREYTISREPIAVWETGQKFYTLPCWLSAYQSGNIVMVFDGARYEALSVPYFYEGVVGEDYTAINFGYLPDTQTFSTHASGIGTGDCWSEGEYKYEEGKLVLIKYTVDDECDGVYADGEVIYIRDEQTS